PRRRMGVARRALPRGLQVPAAIRPQPGRKGIRPPAERVVLVASKRAPAVAERIPPPERLPAADRTIPARRVLARAAPARPAGETRAAATPAAARLAHRGTEEAPSVRPAAMVAAATPATPAPGAVVTGGRPQHVTQESSPARVAAIH